MRHTERENGFPDLFRTCLPSCGKTKAHCRHCQGGGRRIASGCKGCLSRFWAGWVLVIAALFAAPVYAQGEILTVSIIPAEGLHGNCLGCGGGFLPADSGSAVTLSFAGSDSGKASSEASPLAFMPQSRDAVRTVTIPGSDDSQVYATGEDGTTEEAMISLMFEPSAPVTLTLVSSDESEGVATPSVLIFSAADWNVPQAVTVSGVDDAVVDGPQSYAVAVRASSEDDGYDGLSVEIAGVNADDDAAGIVLGTDEVSTGEDGTSATIGFSLQSEPLSAVTLLVGSSDPWEATAEPWGLTFTSADWDVVQPVEVSGVDDDVVDGPQIYGIPVLASSEDSSYDGLSTLIVGENLDDDKAGIAAGAAGVSTDEGGSVSEVMVSLMSKPAQRVTLTVVSSDESEAVADPAVLTFTAADWNVGQAVAVTGVDDDVADGSQSYAIVVRASSGDTDYKGLSVEIAGVNADDDGEAGIVGGSGNVSTGEDGMAATVGLSLQSEPSAAVTLSIASTDPGEAVAEPSALTFSTVDWNVDQTVTVSGMDDDVADGPQSYAVAVRAGSGDGAYDGLSAEIAGVNADDDEAGIAAEALEVETDEGGAGEQVGIRLRSEPLSSVTVMVSSSDSDEAEASPLELTFTASDWDVAQTVGIFGVDDAAVDGLQHYAIVVGAFSDDGDYDGVAIVIEGVNADDDEAGIAAGALEVETDEGGSVAEAMVSLMSKPAQRVTLSVGSSDESEAVADPAVLTFTASDWNVGQAVAVTGVDDDVVDGSQSYAIVVRASSGDADYEGLSVEIAGVNADDDGEAGIVGGSGNVSTGEDGTAATVGLSLQSEPSAAVTLSIASTDPGEAVAEPSALTFSTADWNMDQTVTVSGMDDDVADGPQSYAVAVRAGSGDDAYDGLSAEIAGVNADDDEAGIAAEALEVETDEGGAGEQVGIRLRSEPLSSVTVMVSSSDSDEAEASPLELTFTASDWDVAQTVGIFGVDDAAVDGLQHYAIVVGAFSDDGDYDGVAIVIEGVNADDDEAGIAAGALEVETDEGGSEAEAMVSLMSKPARRVTLSVGSSDESEAVAGPAVLTFSAADWNVGQAVAVTGVDDDVVDGSQSYAIVMRASSGDADYEGLSVEIAGVNADDDGEAGIVGGSGNVSTGEDGTAATVGFSLQSEPSAAVTLSIASTDPGEAVAEPSALTFSTADWNVDQTVTVSGMDDDVADGPQSYAVAVRAGSGDSAYDGLSAEIAGVNADDDEAGIAAGTLEVETDEGGAGEQVGIRLRSEPLSSVTVMVSGSDPDEAEASPTELTFTASDWDVAQTVGISGVDDAAVDGPQYYGIVVGAFSDDGDYDGVAIVIEGVNADDDEAGIAAGALEVETDEGGSVSEAMVSLMSKPARRVTLSVGSSDESEAVADPAVLTFTAADWNVGQAVAVTGVDDDVVDGSQSYAIVVRASSGDADYEGLSVEIAGVNADDDEAGIVGGSGNVSTGEDGTAATVGFSLQSEPSAAVTLSIASTDPGEAVAAPSALTFTAADWDVDQTVAVSGMDDAVVDGPQSYAIAVRASSGDVDYEGLSVEVAGVNADDDEAGIVRGSRNVSTGEDGTMAAVGLSLQSEPSAAVTLSVASTDPREAVAAPSVLTFTAADWNVDQTVAVSGMDDDMDDGDRSYAIVVRASSGDGGYDGLAVEIAGVNADDDAAGIVPGTAEVSTGEDGTAAAVGISLQSEPSAVVTLSIASTDPGEAAAAPSVLTFTSADWGVDQTVAVSGMDDDVVDGSQSYAVVVRASSGDGGYDGQSVEIAGVNADDDAAGIVLGTDEVSTGEDGTSATVGISLQSEPLSAVTLLVGSSDPWEATAEPWALTFTSADWDVAQPVEATGVDDAVVDGPQIYAIVMRANSEDSSYDKLSTLIVGENLDDDRAGIAAGTTGVSTDESGSVSEAMVSLMSKPSRRVTLSVGSSDESEAVAGPAVLTFSAADWNAGQAVAVAGVDDAVADGPQSYAIVVRASSGDVDYEGLSVEIAGVNADDDAAGIVLGTDEVSTGEDGTSATVGILLQSEPLSAVTLLVGSSDPWEATAEPWALTFTSADWDVAQPVEATGVDDDVADGPQSYAIVMQASSEDSSYDKLSTLIVGENLDDDKAGIAAGTGELSTDEGGSVSEAMVSLMSKPSQRVTLSVGSSDESEAVADPGVLTFTSADWNVGQAVAVAGMDDDVADGPQSYAIVVRASSGDVGYEGLSVKIAGVNADDDAAGIVPGTDGVSTGEDGTAAAVGISLRSEPSAAVTLSVASTDPGEAAATPAALTFTAEDWNVTQPVAVAGVDDDEADGSQSYAIVVRASSEDGGYEGLSVEIAGVNADDDAAGIVPGTAEVSTGEDGTSAAAGISLQSEPSAAVTLTIASTDPGEALAAPSELTFTAGDWDMDQTVAVSGMDDAVADGPQSYAIVVRASSEDGGYDGQSVEIAGVNADDDAAGIVPGTAEVSTGEDGTAAAVGISLQSEPSAAVTLTIASTDPGEALAAPSELTFTAGDWDMDQTVAVSGMDDAVADGPQSYAVAVRASSEDGGYEGLSVEIAGVNADDDAAGIVPGTAEVSTGEDGTSAAVGISLQSEPSAAVTLTIASTDPGEALAAPSELTFTAGDWDMDQTVAVSGMDDAVADGPQSYAVVVRASSEDDGYEGLSVEIAGVNADDDAAGIVPGTAEVSTGEDGTAAAVGISLQSEPLAAVTLTIASTDPGEALAAPSELTFTAGDWDMDQTVAVSGMDDAVADGPQSYAVAVRASSEDNGYEGLSVEIAGVNADDDAAGIVPGTAEVSTGEDGTAAAVGISLQSEPSAAVTLTIASTDPGEALAAPSELTFTAGDWDMDQTVAVSGMDDAVADGPQSYAVAVRASSEDNGYEGLSVEIAGVNADDDAAGIVPGTAEVSTGEDGTSAAVGISLQSEPSATVTLTIASTDPGEALAAPSELTFTAGDWDMDQTVAVSGMDDAVADGPQSYAVAVRASSEDDGYEGLSVEIAGVNADDDAAGIVPGTNEVSTGEDGTSATVGISLQSEPLSAVTLLVGSSDPGEAAATPAVLTFTSADWDVAQPVEATGVDDAVADGPQSYAIIMQASSEDSSYDKLSTLIVGENLDDDKAGIAAGTDEVSTDEGGSVAEAMVSLMSKPSQRVTLSVGSSDESEAVAEPSVLTFTTADWNVGQAVAVAGMDDAVADGPQSYAIVVRASSGDVDYEGLSVKIAGVNADDDAAGIVPGTDGVSTGEDGTAAAVGISLQSEPSAAVTLSVASTDPGEAAATPAALTFTAADWNVAQTVAVAGVDDNEADGPQSYAIVVRASSEDGVYDGQSVEIAGVNADDDAAGIVPGTAEVSTGEDGTAAAVGISLQSEPSAAVTLSVASTDPGEAAATPAALTFTAGDWNVAQPVAVAGVDDNEADGPQSYAIVVRASSEDGVYEGLSVEIAGVNADDDEAGIVQGSGNVSTGEDGTSAAVGIFLQSEPTTAVTLSAASSDPGEAAATPAVLTFTSADWDVAQTVVVAGVDDDVVDGPQSYAIAVRASSGDGNYDGLTAEIAGVNADDGDTAGIGQGSGNVSTGEDGTSAAVGIFLQSEPTAAVTLSAASSDPGEATATPAALTFTAGDWNVAQTVAVAGVDDNEADGPQSYAIVLRASSGDGVYDGQSVEIAGVNADDDAAGIVPGTDGVSTGEDGTSAAVGVSLQSEPATAVTLSVASTDPGEAAATPAALTFTAGDWNVAQTVAVAGVDDNEADGPQSYAIVVRANSGDGVYDGLAIEIAGVNADDGDTAGIGLSRTAGVSTDEGETAKRVMVFLMSEPADMVTLSFASTDEGEAMAEPASLTFTAGDWDMEQTVSIIGMDDDMEDGPQEYMIMVHADSEDAGYKGMSAGIAGVNADDDTAGFHLDPADGGDLGLIGEDGETAMFTAVLGSEPVPASQVVLSVTTSDRGDRVGLSAETLVFNSLNWNVRQTVAISAVDNGPAGGDAAMRIIVSVGAASTDPAYSRLPAQTLTVSVDRKEQSARTSVQEAMSILDGAGGAELAANLIARRARPAADLPGGSLAGADLFAAAADGRAAAARLAERDSDSFGDYADVRARRPDPVRALVGSGFSLRLPEGRGLAAWGAAATAGLKADGVEAKYDGKAFVAQIGVEMRTDADVVVGLAVGAAQGDLEMENSSLRRFKREMVTVHPYLAWGSDTFSGWLALGFGSGSYEAETVDGERAEADASTTMFGAGVGRRWEAGGYDLAARASVVGARSRLDQPLRLPGADPIDVESEFWRLRAELEAGRTFESDGGAMFQPYVTASGRQDGGNGPTGAAGELAIGLRFGLSRILTADLAARVQVTDADLKENSLTGTLRYDHGGDRRGLLLSADNQWQYTEDNGGAKPAAVYRGRIGYGWADAVLGRTGHAELYLGGAHGNGRRGLQIGAKFDAPTLSLGADVGSEKIRLNMSYRF